MEEKNKTQSFPLSRLKVRPGFSGIHLFDRNSGLNVLIDEIHVPTNLCANSPRQVSIALTNACDLDCPYCYAPKHHAVLDFGRLTGWLNELDTNGCLSIGFGGGEPTLYRYFVEICRYTAEKTSLAVSFTTHAHHLNDDLISKLAGNVHFVRVSMDGIGLRYETLRGRSFSDLCKRLEKIRTLAPFGINFVVNSDTLVDLDAATVLAEKFGASEFLLLPEQPVHGRSGIDSLTTQALGHWVAQYQGSIPLSVSERGADGLPVCNPLVNETGLHAYAHIDASGTIKLSSYDDYGVGIGDGKVMQALEKLQSHYEEAR